MVLRRLAGALTAACMLHLTVVASDAACATRMAGTRGVTGGMSMAPDSPDMDSAMARHGAADENAKRHCDTPVQPDCCRALASCILIFAVARPTTGLPAIERGDVPKSVIDVPLSELVAPATPPPKA